MNEKIQSLTWDLICIKADIDFETSPDKREHAQKLEQAVQELMK